MASDAPETNDQIKATAAPESTDPAGPAPAPGADPNDPDPSAQLAEFRMPTRKDVSLRELLNKIDDYAPIVWFSLLSDSSIQAGWMNRD